MIARTDADANTDADTHTHNNSDKPQSNTHPRTFKHAPMYKSTFFHMLFLSFAFFLLSITRAHTLLHELP